MKRIATVALAAALTLGLTSCSEVNTSVGQVALEIDGGLGPTDAKVLGCVQPGKNHYSDVGHSFVYYPAGQQHYKFGPGKEDDGPPIAIVKDNITLQLSGNVTFDLNTTNCDALKDFHAKLGTKMWGGHPAYISGPSTDGAADGVPDNWDYRGWDAMMDGVVGAPLKSAAVDAANAAPEKDPATGKLKPPTTYQDLWSGTNRGGFESALRSNLPKYVKALVGGDYFTDFNVSLSKPEIPEGIANALADAEKAKAENTAQLQKNATVVTELDSIRSLVAALGVQGYIEYKALQDGRITVLPVPAGSGVNVSPPSK